MAKKLLSKTAIRFIVQLRNDEDKNYSFADIAGLVQERFGIKVSLQAIAYHYQRNKDLDTSSVVVPAKPVQANQPSGLKSDEKNQVNQSSNESDKPVKRKIVTSAPKPAQGRELAQWELLLANQYSDFLFVIHCTNKVIIC